MAIALITKGELGNIKELQWSQEEKGQIEKKGSNKIQVSDRFILKDNGLYKIQKQVVLERVYLSSCNLGSGKKTLDKI